MHRRISGNSRLWSGGRAAIAATVAVLAGTLLAPSPSAVASSPAGTSDTSETAGTAVATVNPQQIPYSATELVNPGRGQYRWGGLTVWGDSDGAYFPNAQQDVGYTAAQTWPGGSISYYRANWRQFAPAPNVYDFSALDAKIAAAAARGEKFGLRVMTMDSCCGPRDANGRSQLFPTWLSGKVNEWTDPQGVVIPDFNNEVYLTEFIKFTKALGAHLDGDDRVAFFDLSGYGDFGEWHIYGHEVGPQGQTFLTAANVKRLVDGNIQAFPRTRLLALTANADLRRIAVQTPRLGLRTDCLGDMTMGGSASFMLDSPTLADRWKTQPYVTEWCTNNYGERLPDSAPGAAEFNLDYQRDMYQVGRKQVAKKHISLLSSGNFHSAWDKVKMTDQQWLDWSMANKTSGYRYSVKAASYPAVAKPGSSITFDVTWQNAGVAPTYDTWKPMIQLRNASGAVVAEAPVSVDLKGVYAATASVPADGQFTPPVGTRASKDTFTVPQLAAGKYTVAVVVKAQPQKANPTALMPASYYRPMVLAQQGRLGDGAYPIGAIDIG